MNSNSKPEEKSMVNEDTNAEMRERYQESLGILIVGIILLIIGVIILSICLWVLVHIPNFSSGETSIFLSTMGYITFGAILMIIGLILVGKSLKMRREKIE
ncbi:MAG: hypothetical protein ACFFDF_07205 [Candidatus Odinarchaeota archaeon]